MIKSFFQTPNYTKINGNPVYLKPKYIVLHHTAGAFKGSYNILTNPKSNVSAHFIVDTNGDIYQLSDIKYITWHAGVSSWEGLTNLNRYSIGIEVVGTDTFSNQQRESVKKLVEYLMLTLNIPAKNVIRHADIAPKRKTDINLNFFPNRNFETWKKSLLPNTYTMNIPDWAKATIEKMKDKGITTDPATKLNDIPLYQLFVMIEKYLQK